MAQRIKKYCIDGDALILPVNDSAIGKYDVYVKWEDVAPLLEELSQHSNNTAYEEISEMSKAVMCLAIELPKSVFDDVNKKWNAVLAQLHHA